MSNAPHVSRVLRAIPHLNPIMSRGDLRVHVFSPVRCKVSASDRAYTSLGVAHEALRAQGFSVSPISKGSFTVGKRKAPQTTPAQTASQQTDVRFSKWLDTFLSEKGVDTEHIFEVEGPRWGTNVIPFSVVVAAAKTASLREQMIIKDTLVKIDYRNGDVMHFFNHLAQGLAKTHG